MALEKIDIDTLDPAATIVVATGNAHKLTEIEAILGKVMPEVRFVALGQLGDFEDPEENGTTFENDRIIKAQAAVEETGLMGHRRPILAWSSTRLTASGRCIARAMRACTETMPPTTPSFSLTWKAWRTRTAPRAL